MFLFISFPADEEVGDKDGDDDGGEGQEDLGTAGMQRSRCQIFVLKNNILISFQIYITNLIAGAQQRPLQQVGGV